MADWIAVCAFDEIDDEDVTRFDHGGKTYAVYRQGDQVYATDGLCTHEQVHLAGGLLMDHVIECPKHNGRFDVRSGQPLGAPVCIAIKTYPAKVEQGKIYVMV
jgi:3-phenylpropionate/trans-cinnamate dioxygenase ferredoxin component